MLIIGVDRLGRGVECHMLARGTGRAAECVVRQAAQRDMERQIPEADWKRWRKVSQAALERYCEKTLARAVVVAEGDGTGHERYLNLWKFLRKADRKLGDVFDNPRRSVAYAQIAQGVASGMIKRSELAEFTEDTQAVIELLTASNPLK